jgi:RNase H-like domain found in reverse transcriptase
MLTAWSLPPRGQLDLHGTEFRFCRRIITTEGVRYDPRAMSTLQKMGTPQNGGDLVQYVAALNWMRSSLPLYAEKVAPLQDLLELVYKEAKGRTKKNATSVSLEGRWSQTCEKAFRSLQEDILTLMTTAHPDPAKRVCVFTDSSDAFYSGMITQVPEHCHETMFRHCLFTCMVSTYGFRKNSTMVPRYWFSVDLGTFCPMLDFFPKSSMTL